MSKKPTLFGLFRILDRIQLQISCPYKEKRLAPLFQLSCLDITGRGTVDLGYGEENYSSSKAYLFLLRVSESPNDNNRLPKARKLFLSNKLCRSNNRNRTKLSSWMHVSLFLPMSGSCRRTAEQDIVHSLQRSSYLNPFPW